MMFQIYIPGRGPKTASVLEEVGVGEMNRHNGAMWADSLKGPDGHGIGRIVSWQSAKQDVPMMYVESWDWHPVYYVSEDKPSCYIGINPVDPPLHQDMIKDEFFGGKELKFGKNGEYILYIPVAEKLPSKHRLVKGKWERTISSEYAEFYQKAEDIWSQVALGLDAANVINLPDGERPESIQIPVSVANDFVCDAFMLNYKLCPAVIDVLGYIDDNASAVVAIAVLEIDDIVRSFDYKKKEGSIELPVT